MPAQRSRPKVNEPVIHSRDPQGKASSEPILNPSVRVLWRAPDEIQLELGARRVVVDGVRRATVQRLIGRPTDDDPGAVAVLDESLEALGTAGFLVRSRHRANPMPRFAADLAALRARHGERADDVLAARRDATVTVMGTSRTAAVLATLLGAAGVGHVGVAGAGDVRLHQVAPGGLLPADEGQRFAVAAVAAVMRAAPDCDAAPHPLSLRSDLVVLAVDGPVDSEVRGALHAGGAAHLVVQAAADHAVIGPLAVPGAVSCLHCADLQRLDRDHAWSALAVQLAVTPRHGPPSDVSLASLAASLAALQALAYLDGDDPATIEGTIEIQLPDWRLRRRSWPAHPECDCGAHSAQNGSWAE